MPFGGTLAILDTLSFPELMTVLVVALIVLGPDKLPTVARTMGTWLAKARQISASLQAEMRDVIAEEDLESLRQLGELATAPRRTISDLARQAMNESEPAGDTTPEPAGDTTPEPAGDTTPEDVVSGHLPADLTTEPAPEPEPVPTAEPPVVAPAQVLAEPTVDPAVAELAETPETARADGETSASGVPEPS